MSSLNRTLIRILIVLALGGLWLLYAAWHYTNPTAKQKAQRLSCINNLKQIGLAFKIWAGDNQDLYPFQLSTNIGARSNSACATPTVLTAAVGCTCSSSPTN